MACPSAPPYLNEMRFATDEGIFAPRSLVAWLLFTLAAGFVNAGALLACRSVVTHITGSVTNLATDSSGGACILIVATFIGGAMIAALVAEMLKARGVIAFALPILVSFAMLVGIGVAGGAGCFGPFGAEGEVDRRAFLMIAVLSAAMGIVNGSIANATANKVRVSHLTGPATDLAGNIVRAVLGSGERSRSELRWATLRLAKLLAFAGGAGLATRYAATLRYDLFLVAAMILVVALGLTGAPDAPEAEADELTDA